MAQRTPQQKALEYLAEGRIQVIRADRHSVFIEAQGSDNRPYHVVFGAGMWACSCPARVSRCAHILAAELVSPLRDAPETQMYEPDPEVDALLS